MGKHAVKSSASWKSGVAAGLAGKSTNKSSGWSLKFDTFSLEMTHVQEVEHHVCYEMWGGVYRGL